MKQAVYLFLGLSFISSVLLSCKSGSVNLFKPASPHEVYQRKLVNAGLDKTALGISWFTAANQSLLKPTSIKTPYKESGYFAAERIPAAAYSFKVSRGQKINILLVKSSPKLMTVYVDVWLQKKDSTLQLVGSADTTGGPLTFDAENDGFYVVRLQPELLTSGSYTLEITAGPSLGFPLHSRNGNAIQSFFGDGRDANSRKHEGIDIFSSRRTPVLAAAAGMVTRVNENNLGGRVVWLRPNGKNYTLYYAHLDQQIAVEGQQVNPGDTIGLMGNTGNAITTSPHLHFGVYTQNGAVDPLPFVNPLLQTPPPVHAPLASLNGTVRTVGKTALFSSPSFSSASLTLLPVSTVLHIDAAYKDYYKVALPDGRIGFVKSNAVAKPGVILKKIKITSLSLPGYESPDLSTAVKTNFKAGDLVAIMGVFSGFTLVSDAANQTSWIAGAGF